VPDIFLWTGWPIVSGLKYLYVQAKQFTDAGCQDQDPLSFRVVEVISYYERLWNYNQTGKPSVLPYAAFKALGVYDHLIEYGWPSFGSLIDLSGREPYVVRLDPGRAPMYAKTNKLVLSAVSSIKYHYSDATAQVSLTLSQVVCMRGKF
jgi:hypothetical protein